MPNVVCPHCRIPAELDPGFATCLCGNSFFVPGEQPMMQPIVAAMKKAKRRGPLQAAILAVTLVWGGALVLIAGWAALHFAWEVANPTDTFPLTTKITLTAIGMLLYWGAATFVYAVVLAFLWMVRWATKG
jgi:hypothetical protein